MFMCVRQDQQVKVFSLYLYHRKGIVSMATILLQRVMQMSIAHSTYCFKQNWVKYRDYRKTRIFNLHLWIINFVTYFTTMRITDMPTVGQVSWKLV